MLCHDLPLSGRLRHRQDDSYGFLLAALGYFALGLAGTLTLACAAVVLAHAGGSTIWVFSTTLLQEQTEDRFRGRVFSAEFAFSMLSMSTVSYLSGVLIDLGVSVRTVALGTGAVMLLPFLAWGLTLRLWRGGGDSATQPDSGIRRARR